MQKLVTLIYLVIPFLLFGQSKNVEKNGEFKKWHENGQLMEVAMYVEGQVNGEFVEYFDNGNLRFKGVYINDKIPIGVQKAWWANGNIMYERHFMEEYNDVYKELDSRMGNLYNIGGSPTTTSNKDNNKTGKITDSSTTWKNLMDPNSSV